MALLLALLTLVTLVERAAAATVPTLTGYTVSSWSGGDGVSLGAVRAMAQDDDGYLWLGTDSGLYRFDGVHFTSAHGLTTPALPKLPVRALLVGDDGHIWVGLADGDGLYRLSGTRLEHHSFPNGLKRSITSLARSAHGGVWAGHDNGLLRLKDGVWASVTEADGLPAGRVYHVRTRDGAVRVGTSNGLFVGDDGQGRFVREPSAGDDVVRSSEVDAQGRLWITSPMSGFRLVLDDSSREPVLAGRGSSLLTDQHGNLWLATVGQGLWQVGAGGIRGRLTLQNGLLSDGIWSLLEDREGNIWIGTHEGLNRLTRHLVTPLVDLGVTSAVARGVGDLVWATSSEGLLRITTNGGDLPAWTRFPLLGARTLHATAHGDVWVASRGGLYRFSSGTLREVRTPSGAAFSQVTAITSDRARVVWIADANLGLWQSSAGQLTQAMRSEPVMRGRISLMRTASDGTVWIASEYGQLMARRPDGSSTTYGWGEGLRHETILGIWEDPEAGLWVAGSGGVSRLSGQQFVTIDRSHGLPAARITGVVADEAGGLWLAYTNGIARLDRHEVQQATTGRDARLQFRGIDTSEGLAGVPTSVGTNSATRGADGRLWFVTGRGLTLIDPTRALARPETSGPVRIEAVNVDDAPVSIGSPAQLPAGASRLRIDYTALNLTSPEHLRFRYRLEGFEEAWQEAGPRRQAFYTNLEPRDYQFHVQAGSDDGTWQDVTSSWSFSVAPMFYQRPAFYVSCLFAAAGVLGLLWRLRLRQMKKEFNLVLAERGRLSRELHDTLLQSMVGIALKVDSIAQTSGVAAAPLVDVRRDIEASIAEARRTIRNMRSGLTTPGRTDLITALEDAGARATAGSNARCRLVIGGAPYRCSQAVERELLRIAQEALANAVRHGHPSQVVIGVTFDRGSVALRISDDGCGFENTTRLPNHFGLSTMRERAEHLGGRFRLTTSGEGTEVEATIPISSFV